MSSSDEISIHNRNLILFHLAISGCSILRLASSAATSRECAELLILISTRIDAIQPIGDLDRLITTSYIVVTGLVNSGAIKLF